MWGEFEPQFLGAGLDAAEELEVEEGVTQRAAQLPDLLRSQIEQSRIGMVQRHPT
ncbi:MAG: hypothetical protein H0X56_07675, partial [Solirubrobacterales bacterium]|nr:hypothetical protein [Solirubrobacterales bacterium]